MRLINAPRCNRGASRTPSLALPFGGINNQTQPGTLTHSASSYSELSWRMGPNRRQEVIPKEEILMPVLSQPRKLRGGTEMPLPSWHTGHRGGLGPAQGCVRGCGTA